MPTWLFWYFVINGVLTLLILRRVQKGTGVDPEQLNAAKRMARSPIFSTVMSMLLGLPLYLAGFLFHTFKR